MSRTSLHRPRRTRAVCHRPANDTRLLSTPHSLNPHYKRCPMAQRLRLSSDQSTSRSLHGRSPDKSRHALSKGHCQVRAPLTRRIRFASSGDALERSVMSLPRGHSAPLGHSALFDSPGQPSPANPNSRTSADSKPTHHLGFHRRHHRRSPVYERPVTGPRSHPLGWSSTSGGRGPTARASRVSSTSPQKFGAVAKPASMWNIRCRGHHPSVQASALPAQPSGTFHPLPQESCPPKADHSRPFTPSFRPPSRNPSPFAAQPGLSQVRLREA